MRRGAGLHIWFVELGEPLPTQSGQRLLRYGELTRALAHRGHRVTWWACDFSHQTQAFIGNPNAHVACDGVDIVLVHGPGYRRNVGLARLRHVAVHASNLARLIDSETPPDLIVAAMPTIEASAVATAFGTRHGIPVIVDIRDEWPEDYVRWLPSLLRPVGRAMLRPKFSQLREVCRTATALVSVTERQLAYGLHHSGRRRGPDDAVFHTGARRARLDRASIEARVRDYRALGLGETDFIVVFTGTMSPSRPLDALVEATKRLATRLPIKLVLAGKGDREASLRLAAAGHPAILFAGWTDQLQMTALFEIADVLAAPYSAEYGFSLPTKLFDYMAAGRAILSSCPGEAEALLRREGIGLQIDAMDASTIETALELLYGDPATRRGMGERARALFERDFALESIVDRYADHIERLGTQKAAARK